MISLIISAAFRFQIMTLAIVVILGHRPRNQMRCQLLPNKGKVKLYLAINTMAKGVLPTVKY